MTRLDKARAVINEADAQIARYFELRMHAAEDVAAYKAENGLPIFDGAREQEVIEKNLAKISDHKLKPYYKDMLIQLMRISKEYQNAIMQQTACGNTADENGCEKEEN
ncbi:MAG: chorismate mutase [Ruminococcaceae bacterium]|nr:chorismate mutase [Oscillospiraceae bacterium]